MPPRSEARWAISTLTRVTLCFTTLKSAGVTLPQNMMVTTRRTATIKSQVIEGYLKATIEAIALIGDPANKEIVSRLLASNLRLSNPADSRSPIRP